AALLLAAGIAGLVALWRAGRRREAAVPLLLATALVAGLVVGGKGRWTIWLPSSPRLAAPAVAALALVAAAQPLRLLWSAAALNSACALPWGFGRAYWSALADGWPGLLLLAGALALLLAPRWPLRGLPLAAVAGCAGLLLLAPVRARHRYPLYAAAM